MNLYEEVEMIESTINDLLYTDGDIDIDAINNLMGARAETIERGLESLCKIRARRESEIAGIKAEITRLSDKVKREEKALINLEQYILSMLNRSGQKKVVAGTFTVGTRLSSSVWVSPEFNNPEFMRTNTTTAPDKTAIKEALKSGRTIDGAHLVEKENLAIK